MTTQKLKLLVLGSGGREHALCWKLCQSPLLDRLYCAPGNGGTSTLVENIDLNPEDRAAVLAFCRSHAIDLVIIGPEAPLVAGVSDALRDAGIAVFGPSAAAAQLEGSKGFTKDLCAEAHIPTAAYGRFSDLAKAHAYLDTHAAPIVIKADGLAAGKGVIIAMSDAEARQAVDDILGGAFGDAGAELVIEEFMTGEEASFFVLTDGYRALPLATAQDHKRVGDGDTGPNTGGMGAYSPASVMTPGLIHQTMQNIIEPTLKTMAARGTPYSGVLYAGLMLTPEGPKLVEYNARFGDPECQVLMARLESDLLPALLATAQGDLSQTHLKWRDDIAITVVMANRGYPGSYQKGSVIRNIDAAEAEGAHVFHAGTQYQNDEIIATGGRVLNVTAHGATIAQARDIAYRAVDQIDWPEGFCRRDIGWRELSRSETN